MFDYKTVQLMHIHDGERVPMVERTHHDAADHDPERRWIEGARIYGCTRCEDEILVLPPGHDEAVSRPA